MFHRQPDPLAESTATYNVLLLGTSALNWARYAADQWPALSKGQRRLCLLSIAPNHQRHNWLAQHPDFQWIKTPSAPPDVLPDFWTTTDVDPSHPKAEPVQHQVWFGRADVLLAQLPRVFDQVWCGDPQASIQRPEWPPQALAKVLKPGGLLALPYDDDAGWLNRLRAKGFEPTKGLGTGLIAPPAQIAAAGTETGADQTPSIQVLRYTAPWQNSRRLRSDSVLPSTSSPPQPAQGTVAIVGAGLAGALSAHAFAARGWKVVVLEAGPHPASGASGLPVGLLCPQHHSNDPLAELSRIGVIATLALCDVLLQRGQDYDITGVTTQHLRGPTNGQYPPNRQSTPQPAHFTANAGWIKPAALVAACLHHPNIQVITGYRVERLALLQSKAPLSPHPAEASNAFWQVSATPTGSNATPNPVNCHLVVIANAQGLQDLQVPVNWANSHAPLTPTAGQVTLGAHPVPGTAAVLASALPPQPVNGHGHLLPQVPINGQNHWVLGASYRRNSASLDVLEADRAQNLQKAQALRPPVSALLSAIEPINKPLARDWTGVRWTTTKRLPLVGPLPPQGDSAPVPLLAPSPLVIVGFGSRGLSLAPLCAQLLVAQAFGEPLPLPQRLVKSLLPILYINKSV